ncbi:MAG: sulfur carrier protein ThiS [Longimicrobiales bacterium]
MNVRTVAIQLNGEARRVRAGLDLARLLEELGLDRRLVVVEHNREIMDRARLEGVEVREGDSIELVHFVGGG